MTPDQVRGRLSRDAGVTSSSIISLIVPSPMPTLSPVPSPTLSPVPTTSGNLIHRPFAGDLLSRLSPDTGAFAASIALLTGFSNGKSPLLRANSSRGLRLRHCNAEACQICLIKAYLSPDYPV